MEYIDIKNFIDKLDTMDLKDRDLHQQYAILKSATKKIDERVDEIGGIILGEMKVLGEIKKEFDFGKFTVVKKTSYKYSENVDTLATGLKELKKKEEEEGIANKEEKEYLLFK